jgi:hypothetical protein
MAPREVLMRYVGGDLQEAFMARVRGVDPQRCLAVPVDVGIQGVINRE